MAPSPLEISREATADLWPYSSRMLGFNLFKAFAQNTDRLIIGPLLGARLSASIRWHSER